MICGYNYDMVSLYAEEVLFFLVVVFSAAKT